MSWRDRLLPASLGGVRFWVDSDVRRGGRRIALHEYPLRDTPYAEDLGRAARAWSLEAVLLGPDYDLTLTALVTVLERRGPALLTHPTAGLVSVAVREYRVSHTSEEGGLARITLDLVEAGTAAFPLALLDTLGGVAGKARDILAQVRTAVGLAYMVAGLPALVWESGRALLLGVLGPLADLGASLLMSDAGRAAQVAGLGHAIADVDTIAQSPELVGVTITEQIEALSTMAGSPWAAYTALLPLSAWGDDLPAVPSSTPARIAQAGNQAAIVGAVCDSATACACVAALRAVAAADDVTAIAGLSALIPVTQEELTALRGVLLGMIDARQATASDALYPAWSALRTAVADDLEQRVLAAPRAVRVDLSGTEPTLVVAYRLYGDATRADELARRNALVRPGVAPGGKPLEARSV